MIKLRAHHLLCIPRFYHGGYDKEFADNMKNICLKIRKSPQTRIHLIIGKLDDLCKECPHKHADRCEQSEKIGKWVVSQDKRISRYLGIEENSEYPAKNIFNLSMKKVNGETIDYVCEGCIFLDNCKKVGINKSFKKDLNRKSLFTEETGVQ